MIVGHFCYGGHAWMSEQIREGLKKAGITLKTCHEHADADVSYSPDTIYSFIDSCDAIMLPAKYKVEPAKSVNRLALAWSRKKACVASPLPAYLQYGEEGKDVLFAETPEQFVQCFIKLKEDEQLRETIGNNGYNKVIQQLHPRTIVDKFFNRINETGVGNPWHPDTFVQVIIPHYAPRLDYLKLATDAIVGSEGPARDVMIVSSSVVEPKESDFEYPVRVVHSKTRLNFSEANNVGLRSLHPKATHILLLNDDTVMSSKGLRDMFEALGPRDDVILNPYSNCDKGWLHHDDIEVGGVPLVPNMTIEQLGHILPSLKKLNVGTDKTLMPTTFCAMYCTLIPRRVFDRVGLLNTQFSNGGEDYDYSERAKRHGFQTYWTRNAFCFHFGGKTRKVAEEANHTAHHKEDEQNNSLLHRKWHTKQRKIVGIWSGPSWGSDSGWGLDTYKTTGIGGSELCAGRLAETAAANGCHVLMYGDHVRSTQNGVDLIPWQDFRPEEEWFDLFIASRKLDPVTEQLRARKVVVISHDIWLMSGQHISPFHRNKVDKFVCLSPWHKKFFTEYHALPDGKVVVIPNGVNVEMFSPEKTWEQKIATKEYARLHYSSSADRGLTDNILYLLPWLKDAVPELTLHVYYGLNTWKDAARYRNDKNAMQQIENLEKTLESMKDFVFTYGRVNQPTLAEAWSKAYLWFFPTQFSETFCLTACEAQASATPIVCSNVAALETTVGDYGMKVMHNPYSKEGRQFFINYVVGLCKDREQWEHWSRKSFEGGLRRLSWQERWEDYWSQFL